MSGRDNSNAKHYGNCTKCGREDAPFQYTTSSWNGDTRQHVYECWKCTRDEEKLEPYRRGY